jgi:hypothetical protein
VKSPYTATNIQDTGNLDRGKSIATVESTDMDTSTEVARSMDMKTKGEFMKSLIIEYRNFGYGNNGKSKHRNKN